MDQITEFWNALKTDPRVKELAGKAETPKSLEEEVENYIRLADSLGYQLTPRDIIESFKAMEKERRALTAQAEKEIAKAPVSEAELETVAAGVKDHNECSSTYEDFENCWFNDQCSIVISHYGEPQNSIYIDYDLMCSQNYDTYEEQYGVDTW